MELRQLEYFHMVCKLNNITRAAERMHVAQPSVTIAIQKLEEELGVRLFDRNQKQMTLTEEGKAFLLNVEKILNIVRDAVLEMDDYKQLKKGNVKIGIPPMIGSFLFPQIFAHFRNLFPYVELNIIEEGSVAIKNLLEKDELDLGIIIMPQSSPLLEIIPITKGEILLCLPPHHPLSQYSPSVPFELLKEEAFLLLKEDTFHRQIILAECAKYNFNPKIILSSSQIETIKGLVSTGVGISFLLDAIAHKNNEIITRSLEDPLYIQICLVWKKGKYLSKASQAFIDFIKTIITPPQ